MNKLFSTFLLFAIFALNSIRADSESKCVIKVDKKLESGSSVQLGYSILSNSAACCSACLANADCSYFHFIDAPLTLCILYKTDEAVSSHDLYPMLNYQFGYPKK